MAHGTQTVPAVDKIVGPGNAFVNEAKRQVFGVVGIDQLAGPSEIYVLADATGDAEMIATDLLAQAEHDPRTRVGLVTTSAALGHAVLAEVERQLGDLSTASVAGPSWAGKGEVAVAESEAAMIAYSVAVIELAPAIESLGPADVRASGTVRGKILVVCSGILCVTTLLVGSMSYTRYRADLDEAQLASVARALEQAAELSEAQGPAAAAALAQAFSGAPVIALSASGATVVRKRQALEGADTLAVTLEPPGGSPSGNPTGPVLYAGKLTL